MGYFIGINEAQYFVDEDDKVYDNVNKKNLVANSPAELFEMSEKPVKEEDLAPKAQFVCEHCGYFTQYKVAHVQHMKKHKVKVE